MKRVEYFDGSNSRLTRAFLGLRVGDGILDEIVVELYLPTQSVSGSDGICSYTLCSLLFELLL